MADLTGSTFADIFPKLLQDPGDGTIEKSDGTAGATGYQLVVDGMSSLITQDETDGLKVALKSFYSGSPFASPILFEYDASQTKTGHDGWSIINPDHLSTIGSANWYDSDGDSTDDSGTGCWVREKPTTFRLSEFGIDVGVGKTSTVIANNTKAAQTWINTVSNNTGSGYADFIGYLETNKLHWYYDATDNPDFTTNPTRSFYFKGVNSLMNSGWGEDRVDATVFSCQDTVGHQIGRDANALMKNFTLKNISFSADNSNVALTIKRTGAQFVCESVSVKQYGSGKALLVEDCWGSTIDTVYAEGNDVDSSVAFHIRANEFGSGRLSVRNIRGEHAQYGVVFGNLSLDDPDSIMHVTNAVNVEGSNNVGGGIFIGKGINLMDLKSVFIENNNSFGLKICNGAKGVKCSGLYTKGFNYTEANIVLGLGEVNDFTKISTQTSGDTATDAQNEYDNIDINNADLLQINTDGIKVHYSPDSSNVRITNPLGEGLPSGGTGINLPNSDIIGFELYRPSFTDVDDVVLNEGKLEKYVKDDGDIDWYTNQYFNNSLSVRASTRGNAALNENSPPVIRTITSASDATITLPDASTVIGKVFTIIKTQSANSVIVSPSTGVINGAASYTMTSQWEAITVRAHTSNWEIISKS